MWAIFWGPPRPDHQTDLGRIGFLRASIKPSNHQQSMVSGDIPPFINIHIQSYPFMSNHIHSCTLWVGGKKYVDTKSLAGTETGEARWGVY